MLSAASADATGDGTQLPAASASAASGDATGAATQRPAGSGSRWLADATESTRPPPSASAASADTTGAATQRPAGSAFPGSADSPPATHQLRPEDVIAIQQAEAARGPPRSLHNLARDALNGISNRPTQEPVVLDDLFPWVQYVAAHRQSAEIIGPGITQAIALWRPGTNDRNRGGAPRLDFHFYRVDGTVCRVHPGNKPKNDAKLIFETTQWQ